METTTTPDPVDVKHAHHLAELERLRNIPSGYISLFAYTVMILFYVFLFFFVGWHREQTIFIPIVAVLFMVEAWRLRVGLLESTRRRIQELKVPLRTQ